MTFDVFPMSEMPPCPAEYIDGYSKMAKTLFLLPSSDADARVVMPEGEPDKALCEAAALAVGRFLIEVRGLPLDELCVESPVGIHRLMLDKKNGKIAVNVGKCKILCTKEPAFLSGVELRTSRVLSEYGEIVITECKDSDCFSGEILAQLCRTNEPRDIFGAIACSVSDTPVRAACHSVRERDVHYPFIFAKAAASLLCVKLPGASIKIVTHGLDFELYSVGGELFALASKEPPLTFYLPSKNKPT